MSEEVPLSVVTVFNDSSDGFQVCIKNDRTVGSLGIWVGDNPFDFVIPVTLFQLIMVGVITRTLQYILRPIKTPKFLCSVMAGILLGPTCFGRYEAVMGTLFPLKQAAVLMALSKIGITYSIFMITLKMDVATTLRAAKRCWRFGVFPFLASFFVTVILFSLYTPYDRVNTTMIDFPNIFTVSSFAAVSEALVELNLIATEIGQIALSSALVSEMLQWVTMGFQFNSGGDLHFTVIILVAVLGYAFLCIFVIRPVVKIIIQRTPPGKPMKEAYVVLVLLGALAMAAISDIFGIYFIVGPTIYGLVLPNGPPLATTVIERSEIIISELLMPFFVLYLGLKTDLNGIQNNWKVVGVFQAILFVGFMVKVIHAEIFSQMVLYVVMTTAICIPMIKSLYKHRPRVLKTATINEGRVRTIQNIPETSEFNIVSCLHNDGNVHSMIALIEACNPTTRSPISVYVIHLIELLGKSTPILLPMNKHNRKALSTNYPNTNHILRAFENYSHNSSGPVTILSYVNVAPLNSMHEAVCNLAEDSSVHFLIIPFHQNDQSIGSHTATVIRELNTSFLASAKCTVGILVDRSSMLGMISSKLCFHVGIFFIGGTDDREALALGIRMLERPNTRVSLFRFVPSNNSGSFIDRFADNEEERVEIVCDESLIDEFKAKNITNSDSVSCHEIVVEDSIRVLEAIRRLENDYDLVMVGKRHCIGDLTDEEMTNFMDNADQLGIFGDLLVSNEFCNGKVPVLVMQCCEKRVKLLDKEAGSGPFYH
ncbi:cation/H(+) antiporter 15-like [Abrus precatorius]|uniref:Cation/H(+) antiporter 15-like n=1 Tax=Abrus precatorius TaxID=3816 RepID=A0A8B8K2C9_ABRPR|nr:cation/H(+) antiporter 15-like [Abrus precatorius]